MFVKKVSKKLTILNIATKKTLQSDFGSTEAISLDRLFIPCTTLEVSFPREIPQTYETCLYLLTPSTC